MSALLKVTGATEEFAVLLVILASLPALYNVIVFGPFGFVAFFTDPAAPIMNLDLYALRKLVALLV